MSEKLAAQIQTLEFGSTFMIRGQLVVATGDHAPSVYHDDTNDILIDSPGWEGAIRGATGQYGYSGHVMHASELVCAELAQRLAEDNDPGTVFAIVVVDVLPDGGDQDPEPAGWTILRRKGRQ